MPLDKNKPDQDPNFALENEITIESLNEAMDRYNYKLSARFNFDQLNFLATQINAYAKDNFKNWDDRHKVTGQDILEVIYGELVFKDLGYKSALETVKVLNSAWQIFGREQKEFNDLDYYTDEAFEKIRKTRKDIANSVAGKATLFSSFGVGVGFPAFLAVTSLDKIASKPELIPALMVFGFMTALITGAVVGLSSFLLVAKPIASLQNKLSKKSDLKQAEASAKQTLRDLKEDQKREQATRQANWYEDFNDFAKENIRPQTEISELPSIQMKRLPAPKLFG